MKRHNFKDSLKFGEAAENLVLKTYKELKKDSQEGHDMVRGDATIEVKSDRYTFDETPNFFIELYSDDKSMKLGGPWRALKHNTNVFLYHFIFERRVFWFDDIAALVKAVEAYVSKSRLQLTSVRNENHITLGYKIPRSAVTHLCKEFNLGDPLPE